MDEKTFKYHALLFCVPFLFPACATTTEPVPETIEIVQPEPEFFYECVDRVFNEPGFPGVLNLSKTYSSDGQLTAYNVRYVIDVTNYAWKSDDPYPLPEFTASWQGVDAAQLKKSDGQIVLKVNSRLRHLLPQMQKADGFYIELTQEDPKVWNSPNTLAIRSKLIPSNGYGGVSLSWAAFDVYTTSPGGSYLVISTGLNQYMTADGQHIIVPSQYVGHSSIDTDFIAKAYTRIQERVAQFERDTIDHKVACEYKEQTNDEVIF